MFQIQLDCCRDVVDPAHVPRCCCQNCRHQQTQDQLYCCVHSYEVMRPRELRMCSNGPQNNVAHYPVDQENCARALMDHRIKFRPILWSGPQNKHCVRDYRSSLPRRVSAICIRKITPRRWTATQRVKDAGAALWKVLRSERRSCGKANQDCRQLRRSIENYWPSGPYFWNMPRIIIVTQAVSKKKAQGAVKNSTGKLVGIDNAPQHLGERHMMSFERLFCVEWLCVIKSMLMDALIGNPRVKRVRTPSTKRPGALPVSITVDKTCDAILFDCCISSFWRHLRKGVAELEATDCKSKWCSSAGSWLCFGPFWCFSGSAGFSQGGMSTSKLVTKDVGSREYKWCLSLLSVSPSLSSWWYKLCQFPAMNSTSKASTLKVYWIIWWQITKKLSQKISTR